MNLKNKVFFDKDLSISLLLNKMVGVIGYGNQGRAQALNLKDSGIDVAVGLRKGSSSIQTVKEDSLECLNISSLINKADILSVMIPDSKIDSFLSKNISKFKKGQTLLFSHGASIIYGKTKIPEYLNVIMVAPSGGGRIVRNEYKKGFGVPSLVAVHNDFSGCGLQVALEYAKAIGSGRAAVFMSTFKEETDTDIFAEQAILTSSIPMIIIESYKVLLEEGYDPVVSWFVCFYEVKTIVDLMFEKGLNSFYGMVSDTARYGGISRGKRLIDNDFKDKMKSILQEIKTGQFNKELENLDKKNELGDVFDSKEFNEIEKKLLKKIKKIS